MNVILIGMPGSGKSSVGQNLAKALHMSFVDTDDVIVKDQKMPLCEILKQKGVEYFLQMENDILCRFTAENCVIATGGSAVLYPKAMAHLKELGTVIYLKAELETLQNRIHNMETRGIVFRPGQTLKDIYEERIPLYEKYADISMEESKGRLKEAVEKVKKALQSKNKD